MAGEAETGGAPVVRKRFTAAKRRVFLATLEATCNVRAAAAAAGYHHRTAYDLRRKDAGFAAAWRAALDTGYDRIEERLLAHAGAVEAAEGEGAAFDPKLAATLLAQRAQRDALEARGGARSRERYKRVTEAETEAAILRQLRGLARRRAAAGV